MHPVLAHRDYLKQRKADAEERTDSNERRGLLWRWLGAATRQWQRRKMIASLNAMDDWLLRDMGICRDHIPSVVVDLEDRERRMADDRAYREAA